MAREPQTQVDDFVKANDQSPVVAGHALEKNPDRPSRGIWYVLEDRRRFYLGAAACRLLPAPYPKWAIGHEGGRAPVQRAYPTEDAYLRACRALHWATAQLRAHGIEPDAIEPDAPQYPPEGHVFASQPQPQPIDPTTGRQVGDHGTAEQAIKFALEVHDDTLQTYEFLREWRQGTAMDEWPEFYEWLAKQEAK